MSGLTVPSVTFKGNQWQPQNYGWLGWTYDPAGATAGSIPGTAGRVEFATINLDSAASITNVILTLGVAGSGLTASQCLAGLFQGGTLLGVTADQSANWVGALGIQTMALTGGPFAVTAGSIQVGFFYNGTTGPTFSRGSNISTNNAALAGVNARFGRADAARTTTMPGTLSNFALESVAWWAAVS